ncbi:hypothetical protein [Marinobacter sp. C2H3]|uniref:hypothetical protein n=1 Tax=Marinobacter sp. C2H3 TaxID=3119003 RepID=UPI00300F131A
MSLLNDALRAAEQRQAAPKGSQAYVGQSAAAPSRRGPVWAILLAVAVLVVAGLLARQWLLSPEPQISTEPVQAPSPLLPEDSGIVVKAQPDQARQPASTKPSTNRTAPADPVASEKKTAVVMAVKEPPKAAPKVDQAAAEKAPVENTPADAAPAVKRLPDTPEQRDRQLTRTLRSLLNSGNVAEAKARLQSLVQTQAAPRSRLLVARELLARQRIGDALALLPESATLGQPELRLLRARALLADNRPKEAQALLQSDLPPVDRWPAYRVTLAALLQRNGDSQGAVVQWTQLLASDDSQGAWWVGLGIALEDLGKRTSARQAYAQAAALPGLPSALSRYVNQRLDALQAGS